MFLLPTRWSVPFLALLLLSAVAAAQDAADNTPANAEAAAQAKPGEKPKEPPKGDVIVTATRREQAEDVAPRYTKVISAEEARVRLAATDLADLLNAAPGINVQKTARWMGSPFMRGFTGYFNLVMIDGIRYNSSVWRSGPNQYWSLIDPLMVDRLELVYGAGSVLYGSDAVGGAVNVITRRFKLDKSTNTLVEYENSIYLRYSTGERGFIGHYDGTLKLDADAGLVYGLTGRFLGDLYAGDGRANYSGYDQGDGYARYTQRLGNGLELDLLFQMSGLVNAPRTHATVFGRSWEGTAVGTDRLREFDHVRLLGAAQLREKNATGFYKDMRLSVSFQYLMEDEARRRSNGQTDYPSFDSHTFGLSAEFLSELGGGHGLTYGADMYLDRVLSRQRSFTAAGVASRDIQGPVGDQAWYLTAGFFAQDEWAATENWIFTFGLRGSLVDFAANKVRDPQVAGNTIQVANTFVGGAFSARAQYLFSDEANIWLDLSSAFRAPSLSDLTAFDFVRSNEIATASPNLHAEYFFTAELGGKVTVERVKFRLAGWASIISDLIVPQLTGNIVAGRNEVRRVNASGGWAAGIEMEFNLWLLACPAARFGVVHNLSWMDGEVDDFLTGNKQRVPISRRTPLMVTAGLRLELPREGEPEPAFWAEVFVRVSDEQRDLSPSDMADTQRIPPAGLPAWWTLNVRGAWNVSRAQAIFWQFNNILDEDYRHLGSGSNETGFDFVAGLQWRF